MLFQILLSAQHVLLSRVCILPSAGYPFECPLDKSHDGTQLCFLVLSAAGLHFLGCSCRDVTAKHMQSPFLPLLHSAAELIFAIETHNFHPSG